MPATRGLRRHTSEPRSKCAGLKLFGDVLPVIHLFAVVFEVKALVFYIDGRPYVLITKVGTHMELLAEDVQFAITPDMADQVISPGRRNAPSRRQRN